MCGGGGNWGGGVGGRRVRQNSGVAGKEGAVRPQWCGQSRASRGKGAAGGGGRGKCAVAVIQRVAGSGITKADGTARGRRTGVIRGSVAGTAWHEVIHTALEGGVLSQVCGGAQVIKHAKQVRKKV